MENEARSVVLIYANKLNPIKDAALEIDETQGGNVRREYVVDSMVVNQEDVSREGVALRLDRILDTVDGAMVKVILAGFSPLVALVHEEARARGLVEVFFMRDRRTHAFVEVRV